MEQKLLQLNEKLASDSALALQILEQESAEGVQVLLSNNDLTFSTEEIQELRDLLLQTVSDPEFDFSAISYGEAFQATLTLINTDAITSVTGPRW